MDKPKIGDRVDVRNLSMDDGMEIGVVLEVYDSIDVWWETASGESKMALEDILADNPDLAKKAEWYAVIENADYPGETMAVASFECKPLS